MPVIYNAAPERDKLRDKRCRVHRPRSDGSNGRHFAGRGKAKIDTQAIQAGGREVNKALFLSVLFLTVFGAMNANLMVPALLVEISDDMQISVAAAGQLATATFAAWAVSVFSVGPLSDSFGRRPIALAGLVLVAGSLIGSAFAPNFETLLVMRVLTGLGGGTLPPTLIGAISDVISPEKRAQAVGSLLAVGMLTSVVSVPAVAVLADWGGWQFAFIVSGLLSASGLAACWLWLPRDSGDRVRDLVIFSRYKSLISMGFFQVALTVNLSHRIAFWAIVSYFVAYMIHTHDVGLRYVALPLSIIAIGQVIGSYAGGVVAGTRYRAYLIAAICAAGGACGFLFFAVDLQFWVAVGVATLGTGLLSVTFPALVAASTEQSGDSKSTGVGMMGLSNNLGGVLGAAISGGLLGITGYDGIAYLCLGAAIVSVLLAGVFGRQLRMGGG